MVLIISQIRSLAESFGNAFIEAATGNHTFTIKMRTISIFKQWLESADVTWDILRSKNNARKTIIAILIAPRLLTTDTCLSTSIERNGTSSNWITAIYPGSNVQSLREQVRKICETVARARETFAQIESYTTQIVCINEFSVTDWVPLFSCIDGKSWLPFATHFLAGCCIPSICHRP